VLSGGNYFITKPVDPLELALKVTIHLFKAQAQHAGAPQPETKPEVKLQAANASEVAPKPPVPTQANQQMNGNGSMNGKARNGDPSGVPLPITQPRPATAPEVVPKPPIPIQTNPSRNSRPKNMESPLTVAPPVSMAPPVKQRTTNASKVLPELSSAQNLAEAGTLNVNILSASRNRNRIMNNEQDETFEKVVLAVVRIIFGDDNLTEMNVRLVRIALERYNVHEIINSPVVA
jgi:hypothetical protein